MEAAQRRDGEGVAKGGELREGGGCKVKEEWKAVFYMLIFMEKTSKRYNEKNSWWAASVT